MNENDFNAFLSELQDLEKSKKYATIADKLDTRFDRDVNRNLDSKTNGIINKWIESKTTLSNEEIQYLNLLSNVELSFARYYLSIYHKRTNDLNINEKQANDLKIIEKFRQRLFRTKQIKCLEECVIFIRENRETNNDDEMLSYITRMLDARSLTYRVCFTESDEIRGTIPTAFNEELYGCLNDRQSIKCLDEVIFPDKRKKNISISRRRFFLGCCTFAMARFKKNHDSLKDNNQYIYRLAKYVRVVLNEENFAGNDLIIYCLRGILAFITNCIPTEHWLDIINKASLNKDDDDAQRKNPFNIDLFSSIINKLLGSSILRQHAVKNDSNDGALLVDIALVFLDNWCYTSENLNDDDDDGNLNKNNNSSSTIPNQVVQFLRTDSDPNENKIKTQILLPYIDEKYDDRIRLMTFSTLANIMSYEAFKKLKEPNPTMAKDLVKIIFDFIQRAETSPDGRYRGVPFVRLLRYLHKFLDQDFIKKETIPYVSNIVKYARRSEIYVFRILRKISSCPELQSDLLTDKVLQDFLKNEADILFKSNPNLKERIRQIRLDLAPEDSKVPPAPVAINAGRRQAFISYAREDEDLVDLFMKILNDANIFRKIWIDKVDVKGDLTDAITEGIRDSQVLFVLLSHSYANSVMCRREWTFALKKQKKQNNSITIYPIVVREDFKLTFCDWISFNAGDDLYYKLHKNDDVTNLIIVLGGRWKDRPQQRTEITNNPNISKSPPPSTKEYLNKKSINEWTYVDIQHWCDDNNLEKWSQLLKGYDGDALLELYRVLSIDLHLQHFISTKDMSIVDVTLLKSKLDKLIAPRTITQKKDIRKRRASKTSVE